MATTPPLDIVTVSITIATAVFGAPVASIVGPYSVILIGAALGAAWSASRRPPTDSRFRTLLYMLAVVTLALLITVPAAELLAQYAHIEARWILGPVAALIGGIGDDWPKIRAWALDFVRGVVTRRLGGGAPSDPPSPPNGGDK
jgi:hypothetical protein